MENTEKKMKTWFLLSGKKKEFVECEIVKETGHKRYIKILEGKKAGKTTFTHQKGVATGKLYPRVFESENKPTDFFVFKGRVMLKRNNLSEKESAMVPKVKPDYRFQPFLADVIDATHAKENVILAGGAGVGKTSHIMQLAARTNTPVIRANFNGETRLSDFIGKVNVINGETVWIDGILPMAMRLGLYLVLDEVDYAEPSILSLLHPVLEDNPCLVLKENQGEVIQAHPNFRVFMTGNSIGAMSDRAGTYTGTTQLNEAFLDRCLVIYVSNLPAKEELKILKSEVSGLKNRWAKRIVEFANKVRNKDESLGIEFNSDTFSLRRVISWGSKTALKRSPIDGAKLSFVDKIPSSEHDALFRILDTHFGNIKSKETKAKKKEMIIHDEIGVVPVKRGRKKKIILNA